MPPFCSENSVRPTPLLYPRLCGLCGRNMRGCAPYPQAWSIVLAIRAPLLCGNAYIGNSTTSSKPMTDGYLRPVVEDVVDKFIQCGDLTKGFATARCGTCGQEVVIAFSCIARYLCPSCHQNKVLLFGELIMNQVLFPVPHRQYVFTMPKMLRIYFRNDRSLLGKLAALARDCTLEFLRTLLGLTDGKVGMVISIQTFGEFLKGFHPHLHTLTADGLFRNSATFYVMPRQADPKQSPLSGKSTTNNTEVS